MEDPSAKRSPGPFLQEAALDQGISVRREKLGMTGTYIYPTGTDYKWAR